MPVLTRRHVCGKSTPLNFSQPLHYACHHFFSEMLKMRYRVNYYDVNMHFVVERKLKLQTQSQLNHASGNSKQV
jgi:hypothetical protein